VGVQLNFMHIHGSVPLTAFVAASNMTTSLCAEVPTFGNTLGAQLLDVYVHSGAGGSTSAAYASRNYTIAGADAWNQRLEVQGFQGSLWTTPSGTSPGTVSAVVASTLTKTITIALPAAQFGTPTSDWSFSVVLTGQDGYSSDQARGFTNPAQDYQFGVCPVGGTAPICSRDPNSVPKAMDVLTPAGVSQSAELDPTNGPVVVRGVPVP